MKYLLIIATLILMNCERAPTGSSSAPTIPDNRTWCSVEKWNNGGVKQIYTLDQYLEYDNGYTSVNIVSVDSVKADSTFISNSDLKAVIVHKKYSEIENIYKYNYWHGYFPDEIMYIQPREFVECDE
jgi:hypothetical protein